MGIHAVGNIGPCMAENHLTCIFVHLCAVEQGSAGMACVVRLVLLSVDQLHYPSEGAGEPAIVVRLAVYVNEIWPF